jgi:nitrite reductase/ring-hydroxylating ferredoxin subunit
MRHIVGSFQELTQKKKLLVQINQIPYLGALVGSSVYVIPDECPHQQASLYEGKLDGTKVSCPLHRAQFDVVTGEIDDVSKMLYFDFGPDKITTHKALVEGDTIVLDLP